MNIARAQARRAEPRHPPASRSARGAPARLAAPTRPTTRSRPQPTPAPAACGRRWRSANAAPGPTRSPSTAPEPAGRSRLTYRRDRDHRRPDDQRPGRRGALGQRRRQQQQRPTTSPRQRGPGDSRVFAITDPTAPGVTDRSGVDLRPDAAGRRRRLRLRDPQPRRGGAIYAEDTALTLNDMVLANNVATDDGGAVFLTLVRPQAGRLTVSRTRRSRTTGRRTRRRHLLEAFKYGPARLRRRTDHQLPVQRQPAPGGPSSAPSATAPVPRVEALPPSTPADGRRRAPRSRATSASDDGRDHRRRRPAALSSVGGNRWSPNSIISGTSRAVRPAAGPPGGSCRSRPSRRIRARHAGDGRSRHPEVRRRSVEIDNSTISGNSANGAASPYEGRGGGVASPDSPTARTRLVIVRNSTIASTPRVPRGRHRSLTGADSLGSPRRAEEHVVADNVAAGDRQRPGRRHAPPGESPPGFFLPASA